MKGAEPGRCTQDHVLSEVGFHVYGNRVRCDRCVSDRARMPTARSYRRSLAGRASHWAVGANARAAKHGVPERITGDAAAAITGPCSYCGGEALGWDHTIALANGGSNTPDNVVPACWPCNRRKGRYPAAVLGLPPIVRVPCAVCGRELERRSYWVRKYPRSACIEHRSYLSRPGFVPG